MYPTKYTNISKGSFLQIEPEKLKNAALILFIPKDGYHNNKESYPEGYIPTLKAHAKHAKDVLYIEAEDVGLNWGDNFIKPKVRHFHEIDSFLKKNAANPILAICDAGVSRSGFVSFYLDVKNNNLDHVGFCPYLDDIHFSRGRKYGTFYHTNPALTKYMMDSRLLTHSERKALEDMMAQYKESEDDDKSDQPDVVDIEF